MKHVLNQLINHQPLSRNEAYEALLQMSSGEGNEAQIAAFISVYLMRTITVEELSGFRDALLELCLPFDRKGIATLDLCGTGGDGKDTFNISTLASLVVASAGIKVTKHGNYGVSSICGSSNVLEALGYQFTTDEYVLHQQLEEANICFLHAPLFHPALKKVGPIRQQLGIKTFFNMLGPLVNPARPVYQLTGTFQLQLARLYSYLLKETTERFTIVHSHDGYDEVSLTGKTRVIRQEGTTDLQPQDFLSSALPPETIRGGKNIKENAAIFLQILENKGTEAQNAVVLANAALGIQCATNCSLKEANSIALTALQSGNALRTLKKITQS